MPFPPAGRRRCRRQRRFTQAVENGSRSGSFLIQIFQSWHFYGWTLADVGQNNPLGYSSRQVWPPQREADVKDHVSDRPGRKQKHRSPNKPLQQLREKVCGELSVGFSWHTHKYSTSLRKKKKKRRPFKGREMARQLKSWNNWRLCCGCVLPPMAPSPLKSSQRKWIDLAL